TGHTVQGKFWTYWQTRGGLAQQGYPITDEMSEKSETGGKINPVQYFQRSEFQLHPEFAGTPNEVLLTLVGVYFYQKRYPLGAPNQSANNEANSVLVPETGKRLGGLFRTYYDT